MNIADIIHAQFNAYKIPSEHYVKYILLGFALITLAISTDEQRPYVSAVALFIYGFNNVIIGDISCARARSMWRFFRIPLFRGLVDVQGITKIIITRKEDTSDNSRSVSYALTALVGQDNSSDYIYSSRKYKDVRSLADWLVKRIQVPLEDRV